MKKMRQEKNIKKGVLMVKEQVNLARTNTTCLDFLKFAGACIVAFIWHYQHFSPAEGSPFDTIFVFTYPNGWLMVELFFMLSGFGMVIGYAQKLISHEISFAGYMGRRLNKIYPLFFLTLILVVFLELIYKAKTGETFVYGNFDVYHFFLNVVLCQDGIFGTDWSYNSPSWCISICFILYIILFIVFYHSKDIKTAVYKFAGLGVLGVIVLNLGWNYPLLNSLVARGIICFAIGVFLAYFYQKEEMFNTKLIGYLSFVIIMVCYFAFRGNPISVNNLQMLFILFLSPMIIFCTLYVPCINKLFSLRFFRYLGSLSLEIYLFHFVVQCAIRNIDIYYGLELNYSARRVWVLYVMATLIVSILYKLLFAKPSEALFQKICTKFVKN